MSPARPRATTTPRGIAPGRPPCLHRSDCAPSGARPAPAAFRGGAKTPPARGESEDCASPSRPSLNALLPAQLVVGTNQFRTQLIDLRADDGDAESAQSCQHDVALMEQLMGDDRARNVVRRLRPHG